MTSTTSTSSATKWIGEVPSGWRVLEPRRVFSLRREPERPGDIHLTPSQKYGVLPQEEYVAITGSQVVRNLSGTTMQHVEAGDFISHLRTFQGGLELAKQAGKVSPAYTVVTPGPEAFPNYYKYVLKSRGYISQIASVTDQLRDGQSMRFPEFNETWLPVPPFEEQKLIADYLDRETAEIDAFIGDQKAFRRLLIERWVSGLVNIVQPQLLEPNPVHARQLRPSWTRTRLKSTVESEKNGSWGSEEGDGQVTRRCIRVADFDKHSGRIHSRSETNRSYPIDQASSLALKTGDLLIEKSGGGPTSPVGNVVLYTGPGGDLYSNFVARLRLRADIDPRFALYLHRSLYLSGVTNRSIKQTTGIQNLDSSSYFNEAAWLPPLEEQKVLGQRVEAQRDFIDETLEDVDRSIELAQERRSALISTAVTGQIDVTAQDVSVAEQLQDKLEVHL